MNDNKISSDNEPEKPENIEPLNLDTKRGSPNWRPPYFQALVAFYADPSEQRTLKAFCQEYGVAENTVCVYKGKHSAELWEAVDNVRRLYIPKLRTEAFKSLFARIKKSDNAIKLALTVTRDLIELSESTTVLKTPAEKRAAIEAVITKLSANLRKERID